MHAFNTKWTDGPWRCVSTLLRRSQQCWQEPRSGATGRSARARPQKRPLALQSSKRDSKPLTSCNEVQGLRGAKTFSRVQSCGHPRMLHRPNTSLPACAELASGPSANMALRQLASAAAQRTGLCWAKGVAGSASLSIRAVVSRGFATGNCDVTLRYQSSCTLCPPLRAQVSPEHHKLARHGLGD